MNRSSGELFTNHRYVHQDLNRLARKIEASGCEDFGIIRSTISRVLYDDAVMADLTFRDSVSLALCVVMSFEKYAPRLAIETMAQLDTFMVLLTRIMRVKTKDSEMVLILSRIMETLRVTDSFVLFCDNALAGNLAKSFVTFSDSGADFVAHMVRCANVLDPPLLAVVVDNIDKKGVSVGLRAISKEKQEMIVIETLKSGNGNTVNKFISLARLFDLNLVDLLEELQTEIINEDDERRKEAIVITSEILAKSLNRIEEHHRDMIAFLLKRGDDRVESVRATIVDLCFRLLDCGTVDLSDICIPVIQDRMCDPQQSVRKRCWQRRISIEYDYGVFVRDRNRDVATKVLDFCVEDIENGVTRTISPLITCYMTGMKNDIVGRIKRLLKLFSIVRLSLMVGPNEIHGFFKIIRDIVDIQQDFRNIICDFCPTTYERYAAMFTYRLWSAHLPSQLIWSLIQDEDFEQISNMTSIEFCSEIQALLVTFELDAQEVISTNNKEIILGFASIAPHSFVPLCQEMHEYHSLLRSDIIAIRAVFEKLNNKKEIMTKLISIRTDASLMALASICRKTVLYGDLLPVSVDDSLSLVLNIDNSPYHVDLSGRSHMFYMRFFTRLGDATIVPRALLQFRDLADAPSREIIAASKLMKLIGSDVHVSFAVDVIQYRDDHTACHAVQYIASLSAVPATLLDKVATHISKKRGRPRMKMLDSLEKVETPCSVVLMILAFGRDQDEKICGRAQRILTERLTSMNQKREDRKNIMKSLRCSSNYPEYRGLLAKLSNGKQPHSPG